MPSAQVPFVANDKLDVLGNEIDTVSEVDQLRIGSASGRGLTSMTTGPRSVHRSSVFVGHLSRSRARKQLSETSTICACCSSVSGAG